MKEIEGRINQQYARNIIAVCDNEICKNEKVINIRTYKYHTYRHEGKYYCNDCNSVKNIINRNRIFTQKQDNKELKRGDKYYWTFKENILKELDLHIKQYGTVNGLGVIDNALYAAICGNGHSVGTLVEELGYKFEDLSKYYLDNRGDYNASMGEVYVSNWLIAQGYKDYYDRNVIINKDDGNYNSDFRMIANDGHELRIEVWGYQENDNGFYKDAYMKTRKIKEKLYDKYKKCMTLISIEQSDLTSMKKMQDKLYSKLGKFFTLPFKQINWMQIKCYEDLSEEEFVKELIQYGTNGKFPTKSELLLRATSRLITYAQKIGGLTYLAKKYGYESYCKMRHWNENSVFDAYIHMLNKYEKFLSNNDLEKLGKQDPILVGFKDFVKDNGGVIYWKILFSKYLIKNNISNDYFSPHNYLQGVLTSVDNEFNHRKDHHKILAQNIISELNI